MSSVSQDRVVEKERRRKGILGEQFLNRLSPSYCEKDRYEGTGITQEMLDKIIDYLTLHKCETVVNYKGNYCTLKVSGISSRSIELERSCSSCAWAYYAIDSYKCSSCLGSADKKNWTKRG